MDLHGFGQILVVSHTLAAIFGGIVAACIIYRVLHKGGGHDRSCSE